MNLADIIDNLLLLMLLLLCVLVSLFCIEYASIWVGLLLLESIDCERS